MSVDTWVVTGARRSSGRERPDSTSPSPGFDPTLREFTAVPQIHIPNTPWDCHICRSVGVVWGVNVGIYDIHGVCEIWIGSGPDP